MPPKRRIVVVPVLRARMQHGVVAAELQVVRPHLEGEVEVRIGDRADWSYLLPHRLRKGRYTIGVMAVDKRFNEARAVVHVRVK